MKHTELITILVLSMLCASCDNNNNELSGTAVAVQIRSLKMAESGEEDLLRSTSKQEAETVSTPLGDGLLLEISMERDESLARNAGIEDRRAFSSDSGEGGYK
jgi:hypothetical protein